MEKALYRCTTLLFFNPTPPELMGELTLTGVKTKKMPLSMGTLFVNIYIRYDITVYLMYVVKHCQNPHPIGQNICSIDFRSTTMTRGLWGLYLTGALASKSRCLISLQHGPSEIGLPEIELPEIGLPKIGLPEIGLPETGLPEIGLPRVPAAKELERLLLEARAWSPFLWQTLVTVCLNTLK